jgi:hypothetical protein
MHTKHRRSFHRRDFLKLGGAFAAASLACACTPEGQGTMSQTSTQESPFSASQPSVENLPAPLAVIALNRMGFGANYKPLGIYR